MTDIQYLQSDIRSYARAVTGTTWEFTGDLHALCDLYGITAGRQLNERLMALTGQSTIQAAWLYTQTYGALGLIFGYSGSYGGVYAPGTFSKMLQLYNDVTQVAAAGDSVGLMLPVNANETIVNYFTETDNQSAAVWTKVGSTTVTVNVVNAPSAVMNGAPVADLVNDVAGGQGTYQQYTMPSTGLTICHSRYFFAGTSTALLFRDDSGAGRHIAVNLSTGVVSSTSGTLLNYGCQDAGGGWYRVFMAFTSDNTVVRQIGRANAGAGTFYTCGAQTEVGVTTPSAYQPNAGSLGGSNRRTGGVNQLLFTKTLSTQNVTTLNTAYTLSFTGTGTVTLSGTSTAGPLVGSGASRVTLTFTPTAGTLTLTVSGTVSDAQLEWGSSFTSYTQNMEVIGGLLQYVVPFQSTSASRPLESQYPRNGINNLWTMPTEDLSGASYTATALAITTSSGSSPGSTTTINTLTADGAASAHWFGAVGTGDVAGAKTVSVYAKAGSHSIMQLAVAGTAVPYANYDLTNGTAQAFGAGTTATITAVPGYSGWYRCELYTPDTSAINLRIAFAVDLSSARLVSFTTSNTLLVKGIMTNFGTTARTYQTVTSAAVITEVGQPSVYIPWSDGTDDYLTTGVQSFGTASLFAAAGQAWTVFGAFRTVVKGTNPTMLAKASGTDANRTLQCRVTSVDESLAINCRGTTTSGLLATASDGVFHTWCLRWDGTSLKIKIDNGAFQAVSVGSASEEAEPIIIGARTSGAAAFFLGHNLVDMIDRALTDAEVSQLMTSLNQTFRYGL